MILNRTQYSSENKNEVLTRVRTLETKRGGVVVGVVVVVVVVAVVVSPPPPDQLPNLGVLTHYANFLK